MLCCLPLVSCTHVYIILLSPIIDFDHKASSQSCPGTLAQIAEIIDSQYTKLDDMDSGYKCYEASSLDSDDGTYKIATRYICTHTQQNSSALIFATFAS